jgi:hypothetical protein
LHLNGTLLHENSLSSFFMLAESRNKIFDWTQVFAVRVEYGSDVEQFRVERRVVTHFLG